jgi:hypothetical protein
LLSQLLLPILSHCVWLVIRCTCSPLSFTMHCVPTNSLNCLSLADPSKAHTFGERVRLPSVLMSFCNSGLGITSLIEHRHNFLSRCHLVLLVNDTRLETVKLYTWVLCPTIVFKISLSMHIRYKTTKFQSTFVISMSYLYRPVSNEVCCPQTNWNRVS